MTLIAIYNLLKSKYFSYQIISIDICITNGYIISRMARQKKEKTKVKSIRLPESTWNLFAKESFREYRSTNRQLLKLIEDFLVDRGVLKDEDRIQRQKPKWKKP